MKIFVNVDSRQLQTAVGDSRQVSSLSFKRGDGASVEIVFVRDGAQVELTTGSIVTFGAKIAGKYDANALVLENGFALTGSGTTASYVGSPSFNTEDLDAALEKDGDDTNDVAYLDLMGEISWTDGPTGEPTSTDTFTVRVNNDVLRGDESGPTGISEGIAQNASLVVTGTLTDGSGPVAFQVMEIDTGDIEGRPSYGYGTNYTCAWDDINNRWELKAAVGETATWRSSETVMHPVLVETWTPVGSTTGTPVVSYDSDGTPGSVGRMKITTSSLYAVCETVNGTPFWKKVATLEFL